MRAHCVARVFAVLIAVTPALAQSGDGIVVQRAGSVPSSVGAAQNFTGAVRVEGRFKGSSPARVSGGTVIFAAGARTAWRS